MAKPVLTVQGEKKDGSVTHLKVPDVEGERS